MNPAQPVTALQRDLLAAPDETLADARLMARALAQSVPQEPRRLALARAFCAEAVAAYWPAAGYAGKLRELPAVARETALSPPARALAAEIGLAAADLAPGQALHEVGRVYNAMVPEAFRARLGVYYTPPALVERLLDRATAAGVDWTRCRVLDPACGGGAFLAPVARRMLATMDPAAVPSALMPGRVAARLTGFEIDPFAAWLSRVALDGVLSVPGRPAERPLPDRVQVCDALTRPDPAEGDGCDLVIGNPPYGRVVLDPGQRARFARGLYGHANLYGVFTDLALRHTRPGGVVAYVTPTSFLAGNYYKHLRALLAVEAAPVSLDFVDARKGVFDDVLQETLLAVYRKDAARRPAAAATVSRDPRGGLRVRPAGVFEVPRDPAEPWLVPRTEAQSRLLATAAGTGRRLRDWGWRVSTGPLVWNRHKAQLRAEPGAGCLPLIWAEAVTPDGRFRFRADRRNHLPWFHVRDRRDDWLVVREPCVLVQRTTAKEQARRLIAAELPAAFLAAHGGAVIENHLNMVRPIAASPAVGAPTLAAFLNSRVVDTLFRCISGSVAVSAFELEALPLPPAEAMVELDRLVGEGAGQTAIEAACERVYGDAA